MKALLFLFLSVLNLSVLFSQSTPQPTPPDGGSNSVGYTKATNSYFFNYSGPDGELTYTYDLDEGGSLKALTASVNNSFTYWPSFFGGITLKVEESIYYPWNIDYVKLNEQLIDGKLFVDWLAIPQNPMIITEYRYRYIIYIEGRTLIIKTEKTITEENIVTEFRIERSYSEPQAYSNMKHYVIDIPYLNLFNVLYTGSDSPGDNRNVFTSFFFDWDSTNAAELVPWNQRFQNENTSVYYAQRSLYLPKMDLNKNGLKEIMYLTVSPKLEDVFPNIPNPVSIARDESKKRIIFDCWQGSPNIWQTNGLLEWELNQLYSNNIRNCWLIIHFWHNQGYDCGYPTAVMPANYLLGGDPGLINIGSVSQNLGYLFSLHEDYWFIQQGVNGYSEAVLSKPIVDLPWCNNGFKQHAIKNTEYKQFYDQMVPSIRNTYNTSAIYVDAFTNALPHLYVDFDPNVEGSGKFSFALKKLRQAGTEIGAHYNNNLIFNPISAEGGSHFLYVGYYDDFEAEIYTGKQNSPGYLFGGYFRPLLVNFDLLKMRDKAFVHGVGLYDRFFCSDRYLSDCWKNDVFGMGHDSALIYTATELAYAHGGYFRPKYTHDDFMDQASIQYNHVLPMQELYADAKVLSILYNDNGTLLTASDYIKKYPNCYDSFFDTEQCGNYNFMGQVRIEYVNGVIVYVNRHPSKQWNNISSTGIWYNCHAWINGQTNTSLETGILNTPLSFSLPPDSGWVCFSSIIPNQNSDGSAKSNLITPFKFNLSQNYPNPFNPSTEIGYEIAKEVSVSIKIYNILGQLVTTLVNEVKKPGIYKTAFDGRNFASGVYFYKIEAGDFIDRKKMVLIK